LSDSYRSDSAADHVGKGSDRFRLEPLITQYGLRSDPVLDEHRKLSDSGRNTAGVHRIPTARSYRISTSKIDPIFTIDFRIGLYRKTNRLILSILLGEGCHTFTAQMFQIKDTYDRMVTITDLIIHQIEYNYMTMQLYPL
jgi:hypothetical protein